MTTAGLTFRNRKADGSILYDCPNCGGRGKLELTRDRRLYFCHKCQEGGKFLKGFEWNTDMMVDPQKPPQSQEEFSPIEDTADPRYRYLSQKRGLTQKMIHDLQPHSGGQWYVVYFPIYALRSEDSERPVPNEFGTLGHYEGPVYFVGRSLFNEQPKYRNSPLTQFPEGGKSKNLWGLHRLWHDCMKPRNLVLCEGVFDAVWSRNRVALMGKTISVHQIGIISRINPEEITVFLDGDAWKESMFIARSLAKRVSVPIWTVDTPRGKDPDDLGKGFRINDHRRRIA